LRQIWQARNALRNVNNHKSFLKKHQNLENKLKAVQEQDLNYEYILLKTDIVVLKKD